MFSRSEMRLPRSAKVWVLAALFALGAAGPLAAAEHGEDDVLTREELLQAAMAGDGAARSRLQAMFGALSSDSTSIANLAAELIGELEGDPIAITDAASLIADVATETLNTQPIVRLAGVEEFVLPPGVRGWDLGAPDSPLFKGFTKLTHLDRDKISGSSGGIRRPSSEVLLSDGLINVTKVFLKVDLPDGPYRLILLTDDQSNLEFTRPLGEAVIVNGVRTVMPKVSPEDWLSNGLLGVSGIRSFGVGTGSGGATVIFAQVIDGRLIIDFERAPNSDILLTGLILEPVDGPSILQTPGDVFANDDEILVAEAIIADAIGQTLETIASAAGDEGEREDILDLPGPETEVEEVVSPS